MVRTVLKGNIGEWSELFATLKLLGTGKIHAADENMDKINSLVYPILKILREENSSQINYKINGKITLIDGSTKTVIAELEKPDFLNAANIIYDNITRIPGSSKKIDDFDKKTELLSFLNSAKITSLKAKSTEKSDITIQIHDLTTGTQPELGFSIKSMIGKQSTLFNSGTGTNFIYKISNCPLEFDYQKLNIDTIKDRGKIASRIKKLKSEGMDITFDGIQSENLLLNLELIDGHLPEIIANLLLYRYQTGKTKLNDLLEILKTENPLKYNLKDDRPFYKYKFVKFLYDIAVGMTPEAIWDGYSQANGGVIVVKPDGEIFAYHTYYKSKFEDYLLQNTKLEQPSTSEDKSNPGNPSTSKTAKPFKFGWVYEEHGSLYLKLNLQIRFIK
jgi:type II restriction enzyme